MSKTISDFYTGIILKKKGSRSFDPQFDVSLWKWDWTLYTTKNFTICVFGRRSKLQGIAVLYTV
eukprot:scaffold692_cov118-Cylindrotheca_fusiformis.AAC.15